MFVYTEMCSDLTPSTAGISCTLAGNLVIFTGQQLPVKNSDVCMHSYVLSLSYWGEVELLHLPDSGKGKVTSLPKGLLHQQNIKTTKI